MLTPPRAAAVVLSLAVPAFAQPNPSGIDFVTIGAPGNPAYNGPDPDDLVLGRVGVSYEYRIGRSEVTTGQWMKFYNAFKARPDFVPEDLLPTPLIWGAGPDTTYSGPARGTGCSTTPMRRCVRPSTFRGGRARCSATGCTTTSRSICRRSGMARTT